MTYTNHGHHIPNSPTEVTKPNQRARCGGPRICVECSNDVAQWAINHPPKPKPAYPPSVITLAKKHNLEPRVVQQMIEQGLVKL